MTVINGTINGTLFSTYKLAINKPKQGQADIAVTCTYILMMFIDTYVFSCFIWARALENAKKNEFFILNHIHKRSTFFARIIGIPTP